MNAFSRSKSIRLPVVKEIFLSCVIIAYIFQAITSLSPDSELKTRLLVPGHLFWDFWGLTQGWNLFSPLIRDINFHTAATITFEDGEILFWQLPRMDRLDLLQRFRLERLRKWDVDSLPWPDYKPFWPAFARYAGRLYYSPTHKPTQFSLHLFWTRIPNPAESPSGELRDRYQLPAHERTNTEFSYFYKPEDFE